MKPYKERLPLIDEAVESCCGRLENLKDFRVGDEYVCHRGNCGFHSSDEEHTRFASNICTYQEFEQRSKELGYINGYKWGVEYPTNGRKPDLPDDVLVEVRFFSIKASHAGYSSQVNDVWWKSVKSFRIVDERYAPKDQSVSEITESKSNPENATMNNDWYEKGELPPVGIECEYLSPIAKEWVRVWTVANHAFDDDAVLFCENKNYGRIYYGYKGSFRPLRTEEDGLVEQAERMFESTGCVFTDDHRAIVDLLIKEGWRPPKQD